MKIETLRERIEKAEEKITKKTATIEKKQNLIEKKKGLYAKAQDENERYWITCDINYLEEDIIRLGREIKETENTLENYRKQLAGEIERQSLWVNEVPELLKKMQMELVDRWDGYDINYRNLLCKKYIEMEYRDFMKAYRFTGYEFMRKTDAEIHADNMKDAESLIINLMNRVKAITGEITDWSGIRATAGSNGFSVLNGIVIGKEGRCEVESIGAGGYNIQRYHIRVLVKPIN